MVSTEDPQSGFRQHRANPSDSSAGWSRAASSTRLLKGAGCALVHRLRERTRFAEPADRQNSIGTLSLLPSSRQVALAPSSSEEGKGCDHSSAPPDGGAVGASRLRERNSCRRTCMNSICGYLSFRQRQMPLTPSSSEEGKSCRNNSAVKSASFKFVEHPEMNRRLLIR